LRADGRRILNGIYWRARGLAPRLHPAGSAIVNAVGLIRQIVQSQVKPQRRYLVIVPNADGKLGLPVQVQVD
jgi:hypothetical protein